MKYDENGRAHHRPGPPVTDELILRVAVAIASRRDAFKPGEKLAQSYLDDAREAVAVFRAVPQAARVTPADNLVAQIETRFPNWRSYRDLIDCIDCTLHQLRGSK